jgi:hypothetical protein
VHGVTRGANKEARIAIAEQLMTSSDRSGGRIVCVVDDESRTVEGEDISAPVLTAPDLVLFPDGTKVQLAEDPAGICARN